MGGASSSILLCPFPANEEAHGTLVPVVVSDDSPFASAEEGVVAEELVREGEELLGGGVVGAAVVDAGIADGVSAIDDRGDLHGVIVVAECWASCWGGGISISGCYDASFCNSYGFLGVIDFLGSGQWLYKGIQAGNVGVRTARRDAKFCGLHVSRGAGRVCHCFWGPLKAVHLELGISECYYCMYVWVKGEIYLFSNQAQLETTIGVCSAQPLGRRRKAHVAMSVWSLFFWAIIVIVLVEIAFFLKTRLSVLMLIMVRFIFSRLRANQVI